MQLWVYKSAALAKKTVATFRENVDSHIRWRKRRRSRLPGSADGTRCPDSGSRICRLSCRCRSWVLSCHNHERCGAGPSDFEQRFGTGDYAIGVLLEQPQQLHRPREATRVLPRIADRKPRPPKSRSQTGRNTARSAYIRCDTVLEIPSGYLRTYGTMFVGAKNGARLQGARLGLSGTIRAAITTFSFI